MTAFEFVSIFFSVVLGLAVTHLMGALGELLEVRSRVRGYWVLNLWVLNLLLLQTHSWWGMWELRSRGWSILGYFMVVIYFALIYLATTLILPRVREAEETIDLQAHYRGVHRAFFGTLSAVAAIALVMNVWLFRTPFYTVFILIPAIFALLSAIAAWTTNRAYHAFYALVFSVLYTFFLIADGVRIR